MNDATIAGVDMRTKFKIIVDILEIAKNGANKTGIVYRTNLNFRVAENIWICC
jgi:predicted transcriptional regulator